MAMNQLYLAERCGHIVFLSNGAVGRQGTYRELMQSEAGGAQVLRPASLLAQAVTLAPP